MYLANSHHIAWDKLKHETINYFIGIKNDLYRVSGEHGLAIYRTCLRRFMKEEGMNMLYFDVNDKNVNYFMDYYVLEEIKSILLESIHQQKCIKNSMMSEEDKVSWSIITRSNYELSEEKLGALLIYYQKKASINHKVKLDAEMYKKDIRSSDILLNTGEWETILKGISNEYHHYKSQFEGSSVTFSALQEPLDEHE
ncbi:hypothetical protein SporoP37_16750 (plasmid) [Sporosarcina sp. P37]|nr:hypothetical protein SporoP37_16750 [Sporosarcina sp. P37]PID15342.1 hypothetical protein CSV62_16275 [Sporosarcina sp. P35]